MTEARPEVGAPSADIRPWEGHAVARVHHSGRAGALRGVADAPTIFWFTLGLYLLRLHLDDESGAEVEHFVERVRLRRCFRREAARGRPGVSRMRRAAAGSAPEADGGAAVFFGAGFAFVTAFTYSPLEIRETLLHGADARR